MEHSVKERLRSYIKYENLSQREFERSLGVSNGYVSSIRASIQPDKLEEIAQQYPDLNITWLLTGKGDMLNTVVSANSDLTDDYLTDANSIKYFYELSATASNIEDISDSELNSPFQRICIPKLAGMVALNITGDSMTPTLNSGDIVIVDTKRVENIINGELYLVVTRDGQRMVKRLSNTGEKTEDGNMLINCMSDNPDKRKFSDFVLEGDRIHTISRVKGSISFW